ncbi:hypothetical protein HY484_01830 [Candidatus Woesearchaeota archaeon]|nr:hypothetical protein [Candidatus Woesearchaeota archaeon]
MRTDDLVARLIQYDLVLDNLIKVEEELSEQESLPGSLACENRASAYRSARENLRSMFSEISKLESAKEVYQEARKLVDTQYQDEFLKFVGTGEASEAFLKYLETNVDAQKAVDIVFETQAKAFEDLVRNLKKQ